MRKGEGENMTRDAQGRFVKARMTEEEADFFNSRLQEASKVDQPAEWPGDVSAKQHFDDPNPNNTYGFSTTDEDNYFPRVISEAKPETNFLFITDKSIDTGNKNLVLPVRKNILNIGYKFPHVRLAYIPLSEWLDAPSTVGEDWVSATQRDALFVLQWNLSLDKRTCENTCP
jgi:hypothetical protein